MPTKQGGKALKNASTSDRCSFRRNTALPAASTPCSWKTRLAMSKPTVVISIVDGSFNSLLLTARAWHIDAVRGRPPHQICTSWLPSANPVLITNLTDFSVCKIDLEHVFRGPDHADRGVCVGVKDFGCIRAVFARCDINVIAFCL